MPSYKTSLEVPTRRKVSESGASWAWGGATRTTTISFNMGIFTGRMARGGGWIRVLPVVVMMLLPVPGFLGQMAIGTNPATSPHLTVAGRASFAPPSGRLSPAHCSDCGPRDNPSGTPSEGVASDRAAPSSPPSIPTVSKTLYLVNDTLQSGNGLGINSQQPYAVAYDSHASEIFVTDIGTQTVSVVSDLTGTVVATIPIEGIADGVAVDPSNGEVFVSNTDLPCGGGICNPLSGNVSVISDATNTLVTSVNDRSFPGSAVFDNGTGEVFVANENNVSVISATSNRLLTGIPVGTSPSGLAYDYAQKEVFVANEGTGNVSVISDVSNTVVATIPVGQGPVGVAYDPASGEVFVANSGSDDVSVISARSDVVVTSIPVGSTPWGVADDTSRADIFVANQVSGNISVLSSATNKVVATLSGQTGVSWLAYDSARGMVYATLPSSENLSVVSDTSDSSVATVPIGANAGTVAYDSGRADLYLAGQNAASPAGVSTCLCILSGTSNNLSTDVPRTELPYALAYDSGKGEVFEADGSVDTVNVISDATNTVTATVTVGGHPQGLVYDPARGEVFASVDVEAVDVISDATDSVIATIPLGASPSGVAYDPTQGEVFVANGVNVSVISDTTDNVVATIPVGATAEELAYDSGAGELFLTAEPGGPPPPPGCGFGSVMVLSAANDSVVATPGQGMGPFAGIAYDGATGEVLVADECDSKLDVYSDATNSLVAVLPLGSGTDGVAYDAASGDIYATNFYQGTVSILSFGTPIPPPTISSFVVYPASISLGQSTQFIVSVAGGTGVYAFTYSGLPTGCVSSDQAAVSCTPTTTGTFTIRAYANDTAGHSANATATLTVVPSGYPSIFSFNANPSPITLGSTTNLSVVASGGTAPLSYAYSGLPGGCTTLNVSVLECTSTVSGSFTVRVFVNDSARHSVTDTTLLTVRPLPSPVILAFGASPNPVATGNVTFLNVTASGGTGTLSFAFSGLPAGCVTANTSSLACAPTSVGNFTVRVFVNDSSSHSATANTTLVVSVPQDALMSVAISPASGTVVTGAAVIFTATPECTTACPTGTSYSWSLSSTAMGSISGTGASVTFTAGSTVGTVRLFVNATLQGWTVPSHPVVITIQAGSPPPSTASPGLSGSIGYVMIGVLLVAVTAFLFVVRKRRKEGEAVSTPPPAENYQPEMYPGPYPPSP